MMHLLDVVEGLLICEEAAFLEVEMNQSSKNLAAAPLLSPLISLLFLLIEVPCVANQLNAPMLFPLEPSTNFKSVIRVSTSRAYLALSSGGLNKYALGLLLIPPFSRFPKKSSRYVYVGQATWKNWVILVYERTNQSSPLLRKIEPGLRLS